ncbi:ALF repeat-containing protein [Kitasatospora sp. NPDC054939]
MANKWRDGQFHAREGDDRLRLIQIMSHKDTGPRVREAANTAMNGTWDDVKKFLNVQYPVLRESDDRVRVSQLIESGGPEVRKAALKAFEGSYEDVRAFLKSGRAAAEAVDAANAARAQAETDARKAAQQQADAQAKQASLTTGTTATTGTTSKTTTASTAATAAAPVSGTLAATGAGDALGWEAGGAAAAVVAGAGLLVASRRLRSSEES